MQLTISPIAGLPGASETTASVAGDVLTVDGIVYDLSAVPEGGEATPEGEHPFVGKITRQAGELHATIRGVYDETAERDQPTDPARWALTITDGPVPMPFVKTHAVEEQPA